MGVILAAAITSCIGIVIAASGSSTLGGLITVAGWIAFIAAIHRLGRSGNLAAKTPNSPSPEKVK